MSGHSRWTQIKHKKAGSDAKRGALFSKIGRMIAVAAASGGPDPRANAKLRSAVDQARGAGMSKDVIERAIARASGEGGSARGQEVEYEAYGPGASAWLIAGITDSPNRTTTELKRILTESGGRLAEARNVGWMFDRRVAYEFSAQERGADAAELALIDAGAEDTAVREDRVTALVPLAAAPAFLATVASRGFSPETSAMIYVPKSPITLLPQDLALAHALASNLEDHPDVTEVWTNIENLEG